MKILSAWAGALALACLPASIAAQRFPLSASPDGWAKPSAPCVYDAATKDCVPASPANPLPVTTKSADGADATLGSTADAPYSGTGAATIAAALKGIYSQSLGPIPAGTATIGNVGGVQIPGTLAIGGSFRMSAVDSAGLSQDIKGDTNGLFVQGLSATGQPTKGFPVRMAGTDTTGNTQSVKTDSGGWLYALPYGLAASAPPTAAAAGAKVPAWFGRYGQVVGGYSDGTTDYYAAGDANGAIIQGAAASGAANKGNPMRVAFSDGTNTQSWGGDPSTRSGYIQETSRTAYFAETSTPIAAGATFVGAVHDAGGSIAGAPARWGSFGCFVRSDQAVTLTVRASNDNGSFFTADSIAVAANTSKYLPVSLVSRYWRCEVTNGSTNQTSMNVNARFGL